MVCEVCYKFVRNIKRHMLTHSGERPYQCECGQSFNQKCNLTRHKIRQLRRNIICAEQEFLS